jgi:predicted AAA+ superfamily ATPase
MDRNITKDLHEWSKKTAVNPLLVRGARQVGKSHSIRTLGEQSFSQIMEINLETKSEYEQCFDELDARKILSSLELVYGAKADVNKTLLFLDEIQTYPRAIMSLRYFKEQMPNLHVVAAGSLLEFSLQAKGFSMPVGRVQYIYMQPLSFIEFLSAINEEPLVDFINAMTLDTNIPESVHLKLNKLCRDYLIIGGMPDVVSCFATTKSYHECQLKQQAILATYTDDFVKYAPSAQHKYLQTVLQRTPGVVGQVCKYSHLSKEYRTADLSNAVDNLVKAGVIFKVPCITASGLPLSANMSLKKFKLLFLDVGLMVAASGLSSEILLAEDYFTLNRGALMEQFVGQELLSYQNYFKKKELYFWMREKTGSMAEVDYIIQSGQHIIPMEVKAGKTGSLRSLQVYGNEKNPKLLLTVNTKPYEFNGKRLNVPAYLLSRLDYLLEEALDNNQG